MILFARMLLPAAALLLVAGSALAEPNITAIFPSSGPTSGATILTVVGSGFGASGNSVTVDGNACAVQFEGANQILCDVPEGTGATNDVQVVDDFGISSNTRNFAYDAPTISVISPSSGPTQGGTVVTLTGNNFGPAFADAVRSVSFGSSSCALVPGGGDHSAVECTTPEGQGTGQAVSITVDGQASGSMPFSYDPPSITSVSPASGSTAGGTRLTINGSSFGLSATVSVDGSNCPVEAQSHSSIECLTPAGSGTGVPVTVTVAGQSSPPSSYDYVSPPSVLSLIPSNAPTAGGILLTISGSNFSAAGNTATVGGSACAVTAETSVTVVCSLPEGTGLDKEVQVTSAAGLSSNTALFDYDPPLVTSVEPTHAATQGSIPLTINGSNFGPESADAVRSVTVGTSACPLVAGSGSHTTIQCTLPAGQGLGRTVSVEVDGQPGNAVTIDYDPPAITNLAPTESATAGGAILTIIGTNFGLTATVAIDGNDCPVVLQSHDQLQCTIPPGSGADRSLVVDVSGQQAMSTFDYRDPACGDGIADVDEDCDDTNSDDFDGCSAACETEHVQDRDQAGCIVAMNKAGAKVLKAQAGDVAACARDAETGVACIGVANSPSLDKALAKVVSSSDLMCGTTPHFGVAPVPDVQAANTEEELALARDLFGADPDAALVPDAMAPNRADCQRDVLKAVNKLMVARLKAFGKCKKLGLKEGTIRAPSQLGFCLPEVDDEVLVTKPTQAMFASMIDSCLNLSEDLVAAFPGVCASAADVGGCIEDRVRCRSCRAVSTTDVLDYNCDGYDDGLSNASCP